MSRITTFIIVTSVMALIAGCGDSPLYYTPLPGGLEHMSNGGEFGQISLPVDCGGGELVYPNEDDWFCNEFTILEKYVVGIEIVYAEQAFVNPPVKTRYFILDTMTKTAKTFQNLDKLRSYCRDKGFQSIPEFSKRRPETSSKSRGCSEATS